MIIAYITAGEFNNAAIMQGAHRMTRETITNPAFYDGRSYRAIFAEQLAWVWKMARADMAKAKAPANPNADKIAVLKIEYIQLEACSRIGVHGLARMREINSTIRQLAA